MLRQLVTRNLKLYFRDKSSVFFSLLSVIIVIGLFLVFLAQMQIDAIVEKIGITIPEQEVSYLVHSWIMAGLLSITTLTSVLGGYGAMVNDRERKILMRFKVAPLKSWIYPFATIFSAFVIGVIISLLATAVYSTTLYFMVGYAFSSVQLLETVGLIMASALINSIWMGLICSFLKSNSSFSAVSILIGSVIGFINGLYVPLGALSETVQNILTVFPTLHIASLFRRILTSESSALVFENIPANFLTDYRSNYGITLYFNGNQITPSASLAYMLGLAMLALIIMILNLNRKQKEF